LVVGRVSGNSYVFLDDKEEDGLTYI